MDAYLIDNFITKTNDKLYDLLSAYLVGFSKNKYNVGGKTFYNCFANDGYSFQFIVEASANSKKITPENIYIHHNSCHVWNLEIGPKLCAKNAYVITTDDGNLENATVIRFVNHNDSAQKYNIGEIIKAQVVGFVLNGNIYESEEEYKKAIIRNKSIEVGDNRMLPLRLLLNNSAKKSEVERNAKLPDEDRILKAKFKIGTCHKFSLSIAGKECPTYYATEVETLYGNMYIFFNMNLLDKPVEQFKKGDIFAGNIMLSGDVLLPENSANYQASTKKDLESVMNLIDLTGKSIKDIDTFGVIDDLASKKTRETKQLFGFCTDLPLHLKLNDGRTISINAPSFKDIYEGFSVAVNPKPFDYKRDNELNVTGYCKECLGKKIIGYKVTKYGKDVPDHVQSITPDSSRELILELEDGTKMIFSHWLMAEYMDFTVKLHKVDS